MEHRATRLRLLTFNTIPMRAFHLTWMAFFVCFFAWFAVAPLMPTIRADLGLTPAQVANINIAAVCVTILVRLLIGPLCDRYGPRLTLVVASALCALAVRFTQEQKLEERRRYNDALALKATQADAEGIADVA